MSSPLQGHNRACVFVYDLKKMALQPLTSQVELLLQASLGLWFSAWALRRKLGWDYKLSKAAQMVCWGVVGIGYGVATSTLGPGPVRAVALVVGLCFLCWPNLAYRLTNIFIAWPTTEACLVSIAECDSGNVIGYRFCRAGERLGGSTLCKKKARGCDAAEYSVVQSVVVRYDPLNPTQSRIVTVPNSTSLR